MYESINNYPLVNFFFGVYMYIYLLVRGEIKLIVNYIKFHISNYIDVCVFIHIACALYK